MSKLVKILGTITLISICLCLAAAAVVFLAVENDSPVTAIQATAEPVQAVQVNQATAVPVITAIPAASATPEPTATTAPGSVRSNPHPAGIAAPVEDGLLAVQRFERNQTETVLGMNMFNTDPETGQEWSLVYLRFECTLAESESCTTALMDIELIVGGTVVSREIMTSLDGPFPREILGQGSGEGCIGYIIDQGAEDVVLSVNQRGERVFFAVE